MSAIELAMRLKKMAASRRLCSGRASAPLGQVAHNRGVAVFNLILQCVIVAFCTTARSFVMYERFLLNAEKARLMRY